MTPESAVSTEARGNGLVGTNIVGVHHVGVAVRDLDRSIAWYTELFGLTPDFVQTSEGPGVSELVDVQDAKLRFAFLRVGNTILELLEYLTPRGRDYDRRNCDIGATHICFEVDNLARVFRLLSERGVCFTTSEPVRLDGSLQGHSCCYFQDPDGIQLELWESPGRAAAD